MSMKKYEEWNANHKHDNPPREKIVKLGERLLMLPDTFSVVSKLKILNIGDWLKLSVMKWQILL